MCTHYTITKKTGSCRLKRGAVKREGAKKSERRSCSIIRRAKAPSKESEKKKQLTKWEKLGISFGVIGAVGAVTSALAAMCR